MGSHWTHLTATVSNFERSIEFYQQFCGLSVVRDRRKDGSGTVWLGPPPLPGKNPTFVLVLMEGEVSSRLDHLGFQCDSVVEVDEIAKKAEREGILVYPPTNSGGSVGYWTIIRDPDGHQIEFTFGQPLVGVE
jgi:catechol 2,3-dioxygenase-like lactoylglutathione lyase family enzyme